MGINMIEKITSTTNQLIKNVAKLQQKKYRDAEKLFLAEGEKAINGLNEAEYKIEMLFLTEDNENKCSHIVSKQKYLVSTAVISKISTTKTPCDIVAVVKQKNYDKKIFYKKNRLILLENIKDAGNLGTILRSCKAFDIEGIILLGNTIDLYNPKVVRASVGCFDLPVINMNNEDLKKFKSHNFYSTALYENSEPLSKIKFKTPMIIAFGAEADGLSKTFLAENFNNCKNITIETSTHVESLNLASAVSICLYKIFTTI